MHRRLRTKQCFEPPNQIFGMSHARSPGRQPPRPGTPDRNGHLRPRGRSLSSGGVSAPGVSPSLICDPATPSGLENALRSTSGHPRQSDRLREPRQDERTCNLSACTRTGSRRLDLLAAAGTYLTGLLGSRLLDQPIPRSRWDSLAVSLPLHEESAGHDDTHRSSARARALARVLVREEHNSPPTSW